jgi:hypothetical protein
MKRFAALFSALDQTTSTKAKTAALAAYFTDAPEADRLWCIALLSGRRPRRMITTTKLREWAAERAGIPLWLFEACYPVVGDLSETIALVLPEATRDTDLPLSDWIARLRALDKADEDTRKAAILDAWDSLGPTERFVFNKLLTGGWRMGVSQKLMTRALAQATGIDEAELTHRLMGDWSPDTVTWAEPDRGARPHRRPVAPLPVLPRLPDRRRTRDAGPRHRLAGGAQMGRHPRPADPARRRTLALVAGRGADHRPLPRTGPAPRFPAPRHRHRRGGPGL